MVFQSSNTLASKCAVPSLNDIGSPQTNITLLFYKSVIIIPYMPWLYYCLRAIVLWQVHSRGGSRINKTITFAPASLIESVQFYLPTSILGSVQTMCLARQVLRDSFAMMVFIFNLFCIKPILFNILDPQWRTHHSIIYVMWFYKGVLRVLQK